MRTKSWRYLVILLVISLGLVAGCSQQGAAPAPAATATTASAAGTPASGASGPNVDRVKQAGKLIVLMDATFRPMEYKDEAGKIVGFDVDVAQAFADELGVDLEVQNVNWDGIFVALTQGKGDMIQSSVTITEERMKEMAFSEPYYAAGQMIVVPAGTQGISGPDDLKGKTVAVQIDTTGQEAAEGIDGITEIRKFDGGAETMLAVEQKKVDAGVIDSMVALDYAKNHPGVVVATPEPFTTENLGAAFQKDATDLVEAYNGFLEAANADGRMDAIFEKWGMHP